MVEARDESKRVRAFRRGITSEIPRFPNNRASLDALEKKSLTSLLVTYIGWRLRHVAARPRGVTGQSALSGDPRAAALQPNIDAFIQAVQAGDDLTPYLSLRAITRGYTPAAEAGGGDDSWADKDFVLNVMGLHHFHLGLTTESAGHKARTDEVLFASVTRDQLEIIGLFDHAAFEYNDNGAMTAERSRLWSVFTALQERHALPGQLMIGGFGGLGISTAGSPVAVVRAAQEHVRILTEIDPKLDDPAFVQSLYPEAPPA
ncbi:MAG: hypothetical protein H5T92_07420, partial [Synergistales bacterium]|nr:hypothetical protein [Synergistales bacterium]